MNDNNNSVTREEMYFAAIAGNDTELPEPVTRKELFLAKAAGADVQTPEPITREEMFLSRIAGGGSGGGGGSISLQDKNITENGEYTADAGYDGLGTVTVDVAGSGGIASGVSWDEFNSSGNLTKATVYGDRVKKFTFYWESSLRTVVLPDSVTYIGADAFARCTNCGFTNLPPQLKEIAERAFQLCAFSGHLFLPASLTKISQWAFQSNSRLTSVTFGGTPTSIANNAFDGCSNLTVINVPWAEGAVANAPWGATNATINYNYTGA